MKFKTFITYVLISQFCLLAKSEFNAPPIFDLKSIFEHILPQDLFNAEKIEEYFYNELDKVFEEQTVVETDYDESEQFTSNFIEIVEKAELIPEVTIPEFGTVRGKTMTSLFGRDFLAYQSIPYAMPPTNSLRFQMPVLWEGPWPNTTGNFYDGTFLRAKCPQGSLVVPLVGGREDCLHISIYTPTNEALVYPVMFYIHGGAYTTGDASLYVPTKLMDRDVVVVVVQYRLGSLGFMASGTPDSPGNMGLMDQVMALRWVQKYISYFGGNPDEVTVFGESAGGASASWMMFTPTTNAAYNPDGALFKRIIAESGSALEAWTLDPDPATAFGILAQNVGCSEDITDITATVECMRGLDFQTILEGSSQMTSDDMYHGGLGFLGNCPVIQKDLAENFPDEVASNPDLIVIPEHPLILLEKGEYLPVDYMTGCVRDEGILVLGIAYGAFVSPHNLVDNETFLAQVFIPGIVNAFGIPDITGSVSNALRLAYLRDAEMGNWTSMNGGFADMLGMMFLKSGLWQLSQGLKGSINSDGTNVYFYSFEFESDDSLYDWYYIASPNIPVIRGITHGDELLYLFHLPSLMIDERQQTAVRRMTKLWSNFATYGNPTPPLVNDPNDAWEGDIEKWEPFSLQQLSYMHMSDNFTIKSDFTLGWNHNSGGYY